MKNSIKKSRIRLLVASTAVAAVTIFSSLCYADNPIIQTKFTADPAPMVYHDTVFLYTSHDEDDATGFKMYNWMLYTSTDMFNWTDRGIIGGVKEPNNTFKWADGKDAWAPQCIERNGKFYLYCPFPYKNQMVIGVAVSDSPYGPFTDPLGHPLVSGSYDPTVFIDDDGQAYLYWGGNGPCYYVKLNEDMISTSGDIRIASIDFTGTPPEASYTEGPWLWKKNNHYYLAWASRCCPEGIGYGMSESPTGPWKCKGTIMDPDARSSGNHPGIIDYKGNSYVFGFNYAVNFALTSTHFERRSICVEKMTYNADGTIVKHPWWSKEGVPQIGTLNPYVRTEAETICWSSGVKTEPCSKGGMNVCDIDNGGYIKMKGVDFGDAGAATFAASVASGSKGGTIELHLDGVEGKLIGSVPISFTGGFEDWKTVTASVSGATGIHDLYLVFKGDPAGHLFNIDYWQFGKKRSSNDLGAITNDKNSFDHTFEVKDPEHAGGTIKVPGRDASGNFIVITDLGLAPDIWNLPPLPVAEGKYPADWNGLSRLYVVPEWWRDAKFGAWAHWDPQSMPEQGDWYARGMYMQGSGQYEYNLKHFGHPSQYGYKDICHNWVIDRWKPDELMDLYVEMGARFFMAMGCHHDNFDCYDSKYQPWNSVRIGPKVDIVGVWEKEARKRGMRFGIGFHDTPGRTWGQFMPVRYTSDKTGPMKGVPYDALQTIQDGKGKWWEGMNPVDLYGPVHDDKDPLHSPFANQFMWRVDDAITKYHPDVIYFDEHAGDSQVDLGVHMGLGFLAPQLVANYYNKSLQWNNGKMDAVINLKGVGGRYNSFQNNPELLPLVDRSLVKSTEAFIEEEIMAYPFQTETSIADWHYKTGQKYLDAGALIQLLMQNVCRNGSMLLNITQHGRGDLDPEVIRICKDIGVWLKINGEAVYSSRPFEVYGENSVCYTRNNDKVYATLLDWNGGSVTLKALCTGGATLGKVSKVEMLGLDVALTFVQDEHGLTVKPSGQMSPQPGITNQRLASGCRVLRITHDKTWINDDDPGVSAPGWIRRCNLGTGDYNNDITVSDTPGDVWSCSFTGSKVSVIAPKEKGAGKIEIQIDGKKRATAELSNTGTRQAQQVVCELTDLTPGRHVINIVNCGPGPVAVDAIIVH